MNFAYNHTYIWLFAIAVLQIFSPVLFVPGGEAIGISAFRFLIVIIATFLYLKYGLRSTDKTIKNALSVTAVLVIWMLISIFWSNDSILGIKHVSYFITIMILMFVFDVLIKYEFEYMNFCRLLSALGILIIFVAIYEITTGVHFFRSSLQDRSELDRSLSYIIDNQAWFTFGNPNDLSVHVVVCVLATIAFSRSIAYTMFVFFTSFYLIWFLDSRILAVSLVIFALVFLAMLVKKTTRAAINIAAASLTGGLLGFAAILVFIDRVEFLDVSSFIRLQLVASAFDMAKQTLLVGIGVGGFEAEMWQGGYQARTAGIVNPHNGFGRILAENGVVGLVLFLYLIFGPLIAMRRARSSNILLIAISSSVVVLPLLLSVGSDPLSSTSLQLAIAFLWVGARFATNDDQNQNSAPHRPSYVFDQ